NQHARSGRLLQPPERVCSERLEQPYLRMRTRDRHRVEQPARRGAEARGAPEHHIAHGLRYLLAARGERLRYEERIAERLAVELLADDALARRHAMHGLRRKPREGQGGSQD